MAVNARDLFANADDPADLVSKFEDYKASLNKALSSPMPAGMSTEQRRIHKSLHEAPGILNKAISPDVLDSIQNDLAGGFIGKDLDLAGPGSTGGLHAYDLEAPSKNLVPRKTPIRNRIARRKGIGIAHEYRRITGYTGSGTGGVGMFHPGLSETATTSFGSLALRRGKIISYAGDHITVPFRSFSVSDRTTWNSFQAGSGYEDLRQLSSTTTLHSAMLLEERLLLSGRGTASGFAGAVAAPAAPTVTTPVASGSQTAVTGVSTNAWALVVGRTMWGSTPIGAVGSSAFTAGDVVNVAWTHVAGAESYDVYLGSGSGAPATSAMYLVGNTSSNSLIVQGALPTGAAAASTVTVSDTTAYADGFDGILPYLLNPAQSGYVNYVNGPLANDGVFQDAFATMYDANQADPETILLNGHTRRALSDILKSDSSSNYRITINNAADGTVGALATSIQNEVTGTMIDLEVHPFMPRGLAPIMSWTLPMPDSNVGDCWSVVNTQDYGGYAWPVIEFTYDFSVQWTGTFCAYAPMFSGIVAGITS